MSFSLLQKSLPVAWLCMRRRRLPVPRVAEGGIARGPKSRRTWHASCIFYCLLACRLPVRNPKMTSNMQIKQKSPTNACRGADPFLKSIRAFSVVELTLSGHYSRDWSDAVNVIGATSEPFAVTDSTESTYRCHHKQYRPEKFAVNYFLQFLTGSLPENIRSELIWYFFRPITESTLPFTDPMTLGPKVREQIPAMNYRMKILQSFCSVIFDRNITAENSQRVSLVIISVTMGEDIKIIDWALYHLNGPFPQSRCDGHLPSCFFSGQANWRELICCRAAIVGQSNVETADFWLSSTSRDSREMVLENLYLIS